MKKCQRPVYAENIFLLWLAIAAAVHILVFILAFYLQFWDAGRRSNLPKVISVTLVSLPVFDGSIGFSKAQEGAGMLQSNSESIATSSVNTNAKPPVLQNRSLSKTPESKIVSKVLSKAVKSVSEEQQKLKVFNKPEGIDKALERIKLSVEKKRISLQPQPSSSVNLNSTLAQIQQKVMNKKEQGAGVGRGSSVGSGRVGGTGKGGSYTAAIAKIIQNNWQFSRNMLKSSSGMDVFVRINILADGTIYQVKIEKGSPSEYLNNSVKKVFEKSSPLPIPPKEYVGREVWIGFVFTPGGIEQ
ncbi:MAG: TonB family protein [Chlorobiaceae bacterium]